MDNRRHVSLVGPTLLVGLGIILLLNNLGYLHWSLWEIVRLWPILLIAAGLEVLLGHRSAWASAVAALLVLCMVAAGAWFLSRSESAVAGESTRALTYPLDGTAFAAVVLEPAVGTVRVAALVDSPNLLEADISLLPDERLTEQYVEGERARVVLSRTGGPVASYGLNRGGTWDIRISPEARLDLTADLGVGEAVLNLTGLRVDRARLDVGVGQMKVHLPDGGDAEIIVDGGIGTVTVYVPRGLGVRISADAGLVTRNLPSGYARSGDTYTSPTYERADDRVDVILSLGVGTIVVREVDLD